MSLILKQILALGVFQLVVRKSNAQIRAPLPERIPKPDRVTPEWSMWIPVTPNPKKPEPIEYTPMRSPEEQLYDSRLEEERMFERNFENSDYPFQDFNYGP